MKGSLLTAYHAVWTDWFGPFNSDSAALLGPVVVTTVLILFAAFAIMALRSRSLWNTLLVAATLTGAVIPGAYHPRYGLPMTAIMVVGAVVFIAGTNGEYRAALRTAFLIAAACALPFVCRSLLASNGYMRAINGGSWLPYRATIFQETIQMGVPDIYPTPAMIKAIRTTGPGKLLAWDVSCFQSLLWNRDYSDRTLFLPGTERDRFPGGPEQLNPLTAEEAERWKREIARIRPDRVLVYSNSDYAKILAPLASPAYSVVLRDPDSRGRGGMTLFEKRSN